MRVSPRRVVLVATLITTLIVIPAYGAGAGSSPPVNVTRPIISGIAQAGQSLACADGTWTNGPTAFDYQWNRGGVAIGGATTASLVVTSGDVGVPVSCSVTASNDGGSGSATSDAVVPVAADAVAPAPTPGADIIAPIATEFKLNRRKFPFPEITRAGGRDVKHGPRPVFSYVLDEDSTVKIALARTSKRGARARATEGVITDTGTVGGNTTKFKGLFKNRFLATGNYTATLTLTDAVGNISTSTIVRFKLIVQTIRYEN